MTDAAENWATFLDVRPGDVLARKGLRHEVVRVAADKLVLRYRPARGIPQDTIWSKQGFEAARFELAEVKGQP